MVDTIESALSALVGAVADKYHHKAFIQRGVPTRARFESRDYPGMYAVVCCRVPIETRQPLYEVADGGLTVPVAELDRMAELVNNMLKPVHANRRPIE